MPTRTSSRTDDAHAGIRAADANHDLAALASDATLGGLLPPAERQELLHDLRGVTSALTGYVELLARRYESAMDAAGRELLGGAAGATARLEGEVHRLAVLCGEGRGTCEPIRHVFERILDRWQKLPLARSILLKSSGDLPDERVEGFALEALLDELLHRVRRRVARGPRAAVVLGARDLGEESIVLTFTASGCRATDEPAGAHDDLGGLGRRVVAASLARLGAGLRREVVSEAGGETESVEWTIELGGSPGGGADAGEGAK